MPTKRAASTPPEPADPPAPEPEPAEGAPVDEGKVREVVAEMLASLGITDGDDGNGGNEPEPEADGKPAARTQAAVEADVEGKVREAIEKLRGDEDRDRRLAALETKVAEPERSPVKDRVSTRLMGWSRSR